MGERASLLGDAYEAPLNDPPLSLGITTGRFRHRSGHGKSEDEGLAICSKTICYVVAY